MGSLVSGLPPVVTTQDPPRSFLHEIAFKKVHDAALTCLEQLAYFFVKVFCCFYSSYDKFYAEELAKKNAPPAPPNGGTPAAEETRAAEPIARTEVNVEEPPSTPPLIIRALSPARSEPDLEIAQRVRELSVEALSPTSKKPTVDSPREPLTMVDEFVAPLVPQLEPPAATATTNDLLTPTPPLPLVKDPVPTAASNDVSPVQAVAEPTKETESAPARSASPTRKESSESENEEETSTVAAPVTVTPVVAKKLEGYKFTDLARGFVKMGWGGEYLSIQNLVNGRNYKVLFCQKQVRGWYTATHPDLEDGGEIIVKSGWQCTIEMRKVDGSLQHTFFLDSLQLYQQTTGDKEHVYLARLEKEARLIPPDLKAVDAPERTTFYW